MINLLQNVPFSLRNLFRIKILLQNKSNFSCPNYFKLFDINYKKKLQKYQIVVSAKVNRFSLVLAKWSHLLVTNAISNTCTCKGNGYQDSRSFKEVGVTQMHPDTIRDGLDQ